VRGDVCFVTKVFLKKKRRNRGGRELDRASSHILNITDGFTNEIISFVNPSI